MSTGAPAFAPLHDPVLRAAVLEAVPDADLDRATSLGEGWGCIAYRVPAPRGDLALRIPKPDSWWAAPDLERESRLLPELEAWGLPVPRDARLLSDPERAVLGALQSVIEGSPARQIPKEDRDRLDFGKDVGAFLARLHAFPLDRARAIQVKDVDMWEGHYGPMLDRARAVLPGASARWLMARTHDFLDAGGVRAAPHVLIHADFSGDHLLIGERGSLAGVIDWGDAMLGDPALDFAALLDAYPERFVNDVLETYEAQGGQPDPDAPRRARFYLDVSPIFGVLFAQDAGFPHIARADRRTFAARAAASTRAAGAR